ncbi:MAG: hypothetical protein HGA45_12255 [Chloroflexales bacterium]|nr:hypothetical protein [Chloroflexales bacterium]
MGRPSQSWLFTPLAALPLEQGQRWVELCHVAGSVDGLFADPMRSVVVVTEPGCGLSTSLTILSSYRLLTVRYDPDQWPGQPQALTGAPDHFSHWMAHLALALIEGLRTTEGQAELLTIDHFEFLAWVIRRYLGARHVSLWLRQVERMLSVERWLELSARLSAGQGQQLYGDSVADIYGQIEECLELARRLGCAGIAIAVDISLIDWIHRGPEEREALLAGAQDLLTALTPLQRRGFGLRMGLPRQMCSLADVQAMVRGRAVVTAYDWAEPELVQMAVGLASACDGLLEREADDQMRDLWRALLPDMRTIWTIPGPAAAAALARGVVEHRTAGQRGDLRTYLREALYARSAQLRLDPDLKRRVIWRGMTPITLDETPFRFFEVLWRHRGDYVHNDILLDLAHTRANLDKNISRMREALEPFYREKKYVYIQRDNSHGTWLQKDACVF